MDLGTEIIPAGLLWLGHAALWPVLLVALWRAPWPALAHHGRDHAYLGGLTLLLVLWRMSAGSPPGPSLHLLGASLLTLAFGWELAVIGVTTLVCVGALLGAGDWGSAGLNATLCGIVPIAVTAGIDVVVRRWLPNNPFVFILVTGFAGAAVAMLAVGAVSATILVLGSPLSSHAVVEQYLVFYLLLPYAEAFVTGGTLAWLAMFYPQWVASYRDPTGTR